MPSLTSLSALFLLCLCMCPNYLCSAKELGAQTQGLVCLLAMPTLGSCAGAGMGAAQRAARAVVPVAGKLCFALNSLLAARL